MRVTVESLRVFRLFRDASPGALAELAPLCRASSSAARGPSRLFTAGDRATSVLLVTAGLVRVAQRDDQGGATTLGLFGPRDVVGLAAALEEGATYPADAEVVSKEASVVHVPAAELRRFSASEPAVLRGMNDALLEHTRILRAKIHIVTGLAVEQRLARLLIHLLERFGDETGDGRAFIPLALARKQLAEIVDAREETVIRVLRRWIARGLVANEAGGVRVMAPDDLEALAGSAREGGPRSKPRGA